MPTSYGFTGQRADAASGLDYYGSGYYDPLAGQFTSADSVVPADGHDVLGLSRYAYVDGNPELRTDPSGHCFCDAPGSGDNFFPQSGGRLVNGETGEVFSGPSYTRVYRLPAWAGYHRHHYAPIKPSARPNPPKGSSPPVDLGVAAGAVLSFGRAAAPVVLSGAQAAAPDFAAVLLFPLASPCDSPPCNVSQADEHSPTLPKPPGLGDDYEWRGVGPEGSERGGWYNPKTGDWVHPHPESEHDPHYDVGTRRVPGYRRQYPDGRPDEVVQG